MVRGLIVVLLPDNRDLLAYDELRECGRASVLRTVGFFSDASSDSNGSIEHCVHE